MSGRRNILNGGNHFFGENFRTGAASLKQNGPGVANFEGR